METQEKPNFKHKRYILNKQVGQGAWGKVYSAEDTLVGDKNIAIKLLSPSETAKAQMVHRDMGAYQAMKNEAIKLSSLKNVVSRQFEVDENGNPFIIMPFYGKFLSDELGEKESCRRHFNNGLNLEEILHFSKDISKGLAELHCTPGIERAYGDLKPDNLAMESGKVMLNDLGSATTCVLEKRANSPRDNIGCLYTRAPECFNENAHPDSRSDVWAMGSLMYRMFTGEYLFEKELNNSENPKSFIEKLDKKEGKKLIEKKLKNVPRKFRSLVKKCTDINPNKRYSDGAELLEGLNNVEESLDSWKTFRNYAKKCALWSLPLLGTAGIIHSAMTYEPKKLTMPNNTNPVLLYKIGEEPKGNIQFEFERIVDLPEVYESSAFQGLEKLAKQNSNNNRVVAYLLKTHAQTALAGGTFSGSTPNEYQANVYFVTAPKGMGVSPENPKYNPWPAVGKSIEVALGQSKTDDGKVDLEDVCAIARLGAPKVMEAKRISKSNDWGVYRNAKYSNGKEVIPKNEVRFIDKWLSYYHSDL